MYIPDNYDAYDAYERERERRADEILEDLPKCDWCNQPIEEDYYYDIGEKVCEQCMDDCKKVVG